MAVRGAETGKGIKLNKDGTVPKKNRRKTPMPPHRGIESSPVTQIKVGNGSIRDLLSFIGGNDNIKVIKGKKAIAQNEKEILRERANEKVTGYYNAVSGMAGDAAKEKMAKLSPSRFDTMRQNMIEPRNMGLAGDNIISTNDFGVDNMVDSEAIQGGSPINPMLERGRAEAGRSGGPTVPNRTASRRPPVELPFGENPNAAPDFANMENPQRVPAQPERPQPLKYSPYAKPQQRGMVPEAAMNVSRAQDARSYGMLGGVDEDKNKAYTASQQFAPLVDDDLRQLGQGGGPFVYGGAVKKKKKKKKLAGGGKVTSYNY